MESFVIHDFNYFDLALGSVILILSIKGFMNGVVKEVFGLGGLIGGVYFGSRLAPDAADFIAKQIPQIQNLALLKLLGFMAVLIVIWLGATLIGTILSRLTSASGLSFLDRLLGFIVGGGKYFVIFALIVTALSHVALVRENIKPYINNSFLYPLLVQAGEKIIEVTPDDFTLNPMPNKQSRKDLNETQNNIDSKQ